MELKPNTHIHLDIVIRTEHTSIHKFRITIQHAQIQVTEKWKNQTRQTYKNGEQATLW